LEDRLRLAVPGLEDDWKKKLFCQANFDNGTALFSRELKKIF